MRTKKKEIPLPNSNLYLCGFGLDINGNSVVKLKFASGRAFSIQTNGTLPITHNTAYLFKSKDSQAIALSRLSEIEKEVSFYIRNFGSTRQKSKLREFK